MSDRIAVAVATLILAGGLMCEDQPRSAAAVVILLVLYLWKGPK